MNTISHDCHIKSQIDLYFKWLIDDDDNDSDNRVSMHNLCGQLKDESRFFLGLYHYHTLVELIDGLFDRDELNEDGLIEDEHERDCEAFAIFSTLADSTSKTVETYAACYMIGRCYDRGIGVTVDRGKTYEWFKKAAGRELPFVYGRLALLYNQDGMFERAIKSYEQAYNCGVLGAAEDIFQLYASKSTIDDFNKAYYWSVIAPKLGPYSCSLLNNILATGQFEWIQQHHQYWSHLEMKCTVEKNYVWETKFDHNTSCRFCRPSFGDHINLKVSDPILFQIY